MPALSNQDKRGEGYRVYYMTGGAEFDTTQGDATILGAAWTQLCQVDVSVTNARTLDAVNDACSGDNIEYTAGKSDKGVTVTLNEFRLTKANARAFNDLVNSKEFIPILVVDADLDDPDVTGWVMNTLSGQNDTTAPQDGLATRSLEFKPAARAEFKPKQVYGADVV